MTGLSSIVRRLLIGAVFVTLALAVAAGVVRTGARGQTEDGPLPAAEPGASDFVAPIVPAPAETAEETGAAAFDVLPALPPAPADDGVSDMFERSFGIFTAGDSSGGPGEVPLPSAYDDPASPPSAEAELREATERDPIEVDADIAHEWREGDTRIAVFRGRCRIVQGPTRIFAQKMVVWQQPVGGGAVGGAVEGRERLRIYLEDDVVIERPGQSLSEPRLVLDLTTRSGVVYRAPHRGAGRPESQDPLYERAVRAVEQADRTARFDPTQLVVPDGGIGPMRSLQIQSGPASLRRVRIFPRYGIPYDVVSFPSEGTIPPEQIILVTGGVNVLIDGAGEFGKVDLAADRIVIWTRDGLLNNFEAETVQTRDTPMQIYLEGNVVLRQGENIVRAHRAVYDAREDRALLLDAELRTFLPVLQGDIRVRAERLRQLTRDSFHAQNAWVTASQFGKPGYRIEATDVFVENRVTTPWYGAERDPITGAPMVREVPWVTALNSRFFVGDTPVIYLPRLSGPAEDPNIPLRRVSAGVDRIFGFRAQASWDLTQLLGLDEPEGVEWELLTDYYSDRGIGLGTSGRYAGANLFDLPGPFWGEGLAYYINDGGEDDLGRLRRDIPLEDANRYRLSLRHRQQIAGGYDVIGSIGLLSDRNFLEQYWEEDFDEAPDQETLVYVKQQYDSNEAWTALGQVRVNDFENETEWLPRGDHYVLGESLFGGWLSWSGHSSAGYGRLRPGEPPTFSPELMQFYSPIDYVTPSEGAVLMTRQRLDAPFNLGPLNVTPFVLGEADFWGEDVNQESLSRVVGSAGLRTSLFASRIFPHVQSRIFNLNGLAHKMVFEADYYLTESSVPLDEVPQYNDIDDNAQERYRQRFPMMVLGGAVPPQLDPRFYAVRRGAGRDVSDPYHELIDDQQVVRLAWRHRLQTKVGPPERMRIKDWMTLDLGMSYFPNDDRDNFGEPLGLFDARYRWAIGERTTILADAQYDVFDGAQQLWQAGFVTQRGQRGSLYVGLIQTKADDTLDSLIAASSFSYRMSPKWISTFSTAYDIKEERNSGQSLTVTRVGADFLFHLGGTVDAGKDNVGVIFAVEPRFGPLSPYSVTQLGSLLPTYR